MKISSARMRYADARSLIMMALASVSALALAGPAAAQPALATSNAPAPAQTFDIPAQPLSSALLRFAEQAELQILFSRDELAGLTSNSVQGSITPDEALRRLLPEGAPRIQIAGDRVIRVEPPNADSADGAVTGERDDLVVTGTRIRGAPPSGASVIVLDREAIEETGRSTVQDVIQTLPQNFAGSQNEATQEGTLNARSNFTFASTVDLRGLGADATLTLVNGRRMAPAGTGNFVDRHIVIRGVRSDGRDLIIPREFVQHGFRNAARDAATARLGSRTRDDARRALQREAMRHGPSRLDALIANQLDKHLQVRIAQLAAPNGSPDMTDALKTRARELKNLGLAREVRRNVLQFEPDWRDGLKAMELHLDIRKSLLQARAQEANRVLAVPSRGAQKDGRLPFRFGF